MWNEWDVYRFFNAGDNRYPDNLPPPSNPRGLQMFMFACVDVQIEQLNAENGGDTKSNRPERRRI